MYVICFVCCLQQVPQAEGGHHIKCHACVRLQNWILEPLCNYVPTLEAGMHFCQRQINDLPRNIHFRYMHQDLRMSLP